MVALGAGEKRKRTRLSPEHRREQLLDCAKAFIAERGLNSLTMESLAARAEVSKPLIYKYFDTRAEMLQELLLREDERSRDNIRAAVEEATSFMEIARLVVNYDFDQAMKGDVLQVLSDQPDIAQVLQEVESQREGKLGAKLVDALVEELPMQRKDAAKLIRMSSAASRRAAEHFALRGGDREDEVDLVLNFIFGGLTTFKK